jgi:hypothetical protein
MVETQRIQTSVQSREIQRGQVVTIISRISESLGARNVTSSTKISELLEQIDADDVGSLRYLCNDWFNVKIQGAQWKAAALPVDIKTVGDIAELLATVATVRVISRPMPYDDINNLAGNVFLALCQAMVDRGAAEKWIRPTTPLVGYFVSYNLFAEVIKIAGPASPEMKIVYTHNRIATGMSRALAILLSLGSLSFLITMTFNSSFQPREVDLCLMFGGNLLSLVLAAGAEHMQRRLRVVGYDTFMELSTAIALRISSLSEKESRDVAGLGAWGKSGIPPDSPRRGS